ncbi:hypothetical protein G7L33_26635, partial [Klebsiella quasipneumoniae]|nr:hypothetical protein [Klebsiella quasipneumoniae]
MTPWKKLAAREVYVGGERLAQAGRLLQRPRSRADCRPGGAPIWWCLTPWKKLAAREVYVGGERLAQAGRLL